MKSINLHIHSESGFTLVELMLYIAILSTLVIGISMFAGQVLSSKVKNTTVTEVEQQGNFSIQKIVRSIDNSSAINSPVIASSGASLSLQLDTTPLESPTVYDVSGGVLRVTKGAAVAVPITNSRVQVTSFIVKNLSQVGTSGSVKVSLTLKYINNSGTNEYDYTKTFYGSGTIRK